MYLVHWYLRSHHKSVLVTGPQKPSGIGSVSGHQLIVGRTEGRHGFRSDRPSHVHVESMQLPLLVQAQDPCLDAIADPADVLRANSANELQAIALGMVQLHLVRLRRHGVLRLVHQRSATAERGHIAHRVGRWCESRSVP